MRTAKSGKAAAFSMSQMPATNSTATATNQVGATTDLPVQLLLAGDEAVFKLENIECTGSVLTYCWNFSDGTTCTQAEPVHSFTNCGPQSVTAVISDGTSYQTAELIIAVPCQMSVEQLQMKLNFKRPDSDQFTVRTTLPLDAGFNPEGQSVTVDVGDGRASFTLDHHGRARTENGRCRMVYNQQKQVWQVSATLSKSNLQDEWAAYGLSNADVEAPGVTTAPPVVIMVGEEAFADEPTVIYTAKANIKGTGKIAVE